MSDEQSGDEIHLPADEKDGIGMVGAGTDGGKDLAVAQARPIGDMNRRVTRRRHTRPPCMNGDESSLGRCPDCGADVPKTWLPVEYETYDSTEGV